MKLRQARFNEGYKQNKALKEEYEDDIENAVDETFGYIGDNEYLELLVDIADRALIGVRDNGFDMEEALQNAMDALYWTDDYWTILKYTTDDIKSVDYMSSLQTFYADVSSVVEKALELDDEDDEYFGERYSRRNRK